MNTKKLFVIVLSLVWADNVLSQEVIKATFEQKADKIYIYYELKGDPEKEYNVESVVLKNRADPGFILKPAKLEGAIGDGKFTGLNTIIWAVSNNEMEILSGVQNINDFYFQFNVTEIKSGTSWYYYVAGGIVVGGGALAYLLLKGDDEAGQNQGSSLEPPDRP